ncbi:MAG: KpsF/GutQ family sugar-phosphate isomerase [Planctomycetaceae bacterium]|nr:KpsF/GutQ family sugar-phosphate isomerase [Planctomycetaceae bacterium]
MGTSDTGSSRASDRLERAREVIRVEARTIARLEGLLDQRFVTAIDLLLGCKGKVVCTGMGKAGLIAQKVSATLASTGADSIYLHPAEALHGDLGRIRPGDVLLAMSNSGETAEVKVVVPVARKIGAKVITLTGNTQSGLAQLSDVVLDIGRVDEACPLGLAPTASTSAMLALGDALAMVLLETRGLTRDDFARYHPAGNLGRVLLLRVKDIMRTGDRLPVARETVPTQDAILAMTRARSGSIALVAPRTGVLTGILTDGDFRRSALTGPDFLRQPVSRFMTRRPKTVAAEALGVEALRLFATHKVDDLIVVDNRGRPVGLVDSQDLPKLKIV